MKFNVSQSAAYLLRLGERLLKGLLKKPPHSPASKPATTTLEKVHPWRICPIGQHWVRTHSLIVPQGITERDGHCARNPPRKGNRRVKDFIRPEEIHFIAATYFSGLSGPPKKGVFLADFPKSDGYDEFIRGWTKYWNEVLKPTEPLDPDLVKALIASESSFNLKPPPQNAGAAGKAYGLIQLTDQAILELRNPKGALRDHFIQMEIPDASDANISISAGTRWLFRKKELATRRLKREANWIEAVQEYKAYLKDIVSGKVPHPKGMEPFQRFYKKIKQ
jgi:hypothetical protein